MTHEAQERQILLRQRIREGDSPGIRELLEEGAVIGPTEVETILDASQDDPRESVQALRAEIEEAKTKLETSKKMSKEKAIALGPDHPDSPRPIFRTLTKTFRALGELL
jgi:hypothetical protein